MPAGLELIAGATDETATSKRKTGTQNYEFN